MAEDSPKIAPAQDGPKRAQDGPKLGPRWASNGSQISLQSSWNIEAETGPVRVNVRIPFGALLGPSWGPQGASWGPLGLIFGVIFGILREEERKSKNEGPPEQNGHLWGPGEALKRPSWGHDGLKLAS